MKLWIIYKDGLLISRVISEMLQDQMENYIDVSVGKASKIKPSFIVEKELDYLILGDIINNALPSIAIQKWVIKYRENNKQNKLNLRALSGVLITQKEINEVAHWAEFVQNNIPATTFYPPPLLLKLNKADLVFETNIKKLVNEYSMQLIKFIIEM
jgi:hypothetical protein